jgi:phosphoglycerate dehydrogenase-like enzyme
MFSKALFIDFKEGDIPSAYYERLKKVLAFHDFVLREDPNLSKFLSDTEVILAKISTKISREILDASPKLKYIGVLSTALTQ